ncbi:putative secreted protein with PEP-CTERM sorting signal [Pseudoduganella lurida]|uniref:Putative secreted protein with PEP-CTERM sorting signal n=1 Tax=Pseudoduganella lurida TaxID=1036180 RepID=A0A562RMY3_9BURK|nr:cohesin domain-containing protein [Pseudoduganella lurida]TWI70223.1 putative secreted protein with PEP-CTERM sorting signal [Pseudoduganella lurida]
MNGWKKVLGAALLSAAAWQAQAATLGTSASPNPALPGQVVELDVTIGDVSELFGYQFSLTFDASLLRVTSVTEGSFLGGAGATYGFTGDVDNAAGRIGYVTNTLIGPFPGASGSGSLLHVTFETLASGTSALGFSDVLFIGSGDVDIPITVASSPITVSAVPEPATYAMLGVGLLGVAALRRRQIAART